MRPSHLTSSPGAEGVGLSGPGPGAGRRPGFLPPSLSVRRGPGPRAWRRTRKWRAGRSAPRGGLAVPRGDTTGRRGTDSEAVSHASPPSGSQFHHVPLFLFFICFYERSEALTPDLPFCLPSSPRGFPRTEPGGRAQGRPSLRSWLSWDRQDPPQGTEGGCRRSCR